PPALCRAVQTLGDLDDGFTQAMERVRQERGRTGLWNPAGLDRWLQFMTPSPLDSSQQQRLIETAVLGATSPWWEYLGRLERFAEGTGHVEVPPVFPEDRELSVWVENQRKAHARGGLDADRVARLDRLGFVWDPKMAAWERMLANLRRFHARFGHCRVEHPFPEDGSLSQWVARQRRDYQQQRLDPSQIQRLQSLDFTWDPDAWEWDHFLGRLSRFRMATRHAWITDPFPRDPELGAWAARQRTLRRKGRLDDDRKRQLDALGFVWDLEAADWEDHFRQLTLFRRLYGHAQVEDRDARHPQLARWCAEQRLLWQKDQLNPERQRLLDDIGFVQDLEEAHWQSTFARLKDFQCRHGHLVIDPANPRTTGLVAFIEEQRQARAKNRLHPRRIDRLNALGFIWSAREERWETLFDRFLAFKRHHLHGNVPERLPEDPDLPLWVAEQRRDARRGAMDADRHARLTMAGFIWDPETWYWERMFELFARHQRHHGDEDPAKVDAKLATLGDWMTSQRRMKGSGRIDKERIQRLDALGFVWDPEARFDQDMANALKKFIAEQGHCNIPPDWNRPATLPSWVRRVRLRHAGGTIEQTLRERLDRMGFVWDAREAAWEEMFVALETFVRERHHCIVPDPFPENPRLSQWVVGLRKRYRGGTLEQEKIARLDPLGFVWDAKAVFWEEMFAALTAFHDRFGHCLVLENDTEHSKLSWWVAAQRKARAGGQLDQSRIERLDRLHFVWDEHAAQWLGMYRELFFFHQRFGHSLVPSDTPEHVRLQEWCARQRKARSLGHLEQEKQDRLALLDFIWDPREVIVEEMLAHLKRFRDRFGHGNVPVSWPENPQLGLWLQFQRQSRLKGTLDKRRRERLDALGVNWNVDEGIPP
ncbi:MAG: helicase associated domain-containing protein, partial [Magnetococcales bacterium]|nr:helicase associated domain-containing protein [Magnetococcales bacterium]